MMKVVGNRILLEPEAAETKVGGIIIPDVAKEKPLAGVAVEVGPECTAVQRGEVVLYSRYGGSEVTVDGTDYVVVREEDVLVVLPAPE